MSRIAVVGVSHRTAPLRVRERLALSPARTRCLVGGVVASGDVTEAVAVSTCNRTELYLSAPGTDAGRLVDVGLAELRAVAGEHDPIDASAFYTHRGEPAVMHLYRVAAGLDSLVPGEAEILGQVREALALARAERAAGPILTRLFESAVDTARRVRNETAIGVDAASVGSVAATLAREALDGLGEATVLLVGAGKTSELVALNLLARGAGRVLVMNRTLARAAALADRLGGEAVPLDDLAEGLARADVAICATNAPHTIVPPDLVREAMAARPGRPLVLIDLAVPRDVDPGVREVPGCTLHDIDDLDRVVVRNRSSRAQRAGAGEVIVAEEAARFRRWRDSLEIVPAITGLRALAEQVRTEELAKVDGRWESLSPRDRALVDRLTRSIVNKLLHEPTVRMRELAAGSDGADVAATLAALFDLPPEPPGDDGAVALGRAPGPSA